MRVEWAPSGTWVGGGQSQIYKGVGVVYSNLWMVGASSKVYQPKKAPLKQVLT